MTAEAHSHESLQPPSATREVLDNYAFAGDGERLVSIDRTFRPEAGKPNILQFKAPETSKIPGITQNYLLEPGMPVIVLALSEDGTSASGYNIDLVKETLPSQRNLFGAPREPKTIYRPLVEKFLFDTTTTWPKITSHDQNDDPGALAIRLDQVKWVKIIEIGKQLEPGDGMWESPVVANMSSDERQEMSLPGRLIVAAEEYKTNSRQTA